ncbi:MAG TPA: hypothetical protein VJ721_07015, partial [Chthoniobacterales bacterium]|nr:hypothetical protein [Chthoniobacterales bacterium]
MNPLTTTEHDKEQRESNSDFSIERYGEKTDEKEECEEQLLAEFAAMMTFYLVSTAILTGVAAREQR